MFKKLLISTLLIVDLFTFAVKADDDGQCVMYGSAQSDSGGGLFAAFTGGSLLNKVYNGPPKAFDDPEDIKKLKELCPDLYKGSNSLTCCDHDQLDKLYFQLGKLAGSLLNSCPSCYYNYKQTFCQMVCSPEQSKFINVDETEDSTSGALVSSVDYYLSDTFARGMYDSCKNVRMTGSNNKAFQALCIYSGPSCTHVQLLGDASRLSPFKLNFKLGDKPVVSGDKRFTPLNKKIIPCHEKFDGRPCSCTDCPKVCPVFPDYPENLGKPRARTVMGYDAMVVISVILFCLFCCVVVSVVVYTYAWARPRAAEEQRKPLSKTMTGDDLGSFEEVEPLRSNNSMHPEGSVASTPDVEMMPGDDFCFAEKLGARFESSLRSMFTSWGEMCACRPFIVISVGLIVSFVLGCGCIYFQVVTDPVELWAAAGSRSRIERDYFNEHFEPFYRTEQLIIVPSDKSVFVAESLVNENEAQVTYGPVFRQEFLLQVLDLQNTLENLTATVKIDDKRVTVGLRDICFRPLYPVSEHCTIQTALNYYQNDPAKLRQRNYLDKFQLCAGNYLNPDCFGTYGGPIEPHMSLGGFPGENYNQSEALVITFVVRNSNNHEHRSKSEAWEMTFIEYLKNYTNPNMSVFYNSERSIQDELDRNSKGDILTVIISYVIMFVYISIALGKADTCTRLFIDSKVTLGLSGVLIVVISAMASVGLFSYAGIPATLIIIEVIPFLVLAVGVDNIFILVQAFQRDIRKPGESLNSQIGRIVGEVGPSMLLSSVAESCCFFLGALSDMPAVRIFALYAGTALIFDFALQITCFISLLALDAKRQEQNRLDVCCCVQADKKQESSTSSEGLLYKVFKNFYAPFLMNFNVRCLVIVLFVGWTCSSLAVVNKIEIGLDQELAMPEDSFVVDYFQNLRKYLSVGPPVYFVIKDGYNYSDLDQQNRICNTELNCNWNSMLAQINIASERRNKTYIAKSAYSWLDTYFQFRNGDCCKYFDANESYCPSSYDGSECSSCPSNRGRPVGDNFHTFVPYFLNDIPSIKCISGGKALYNNLVETISENNGSDYSIGATSFMAYHTVLKTSKDFYEALRWARIISDNLTDHLRGNRSDVNVEVFPYSVFYVFYEQYLTTWSDTLKSLGISVITIYIVTFLLLGFDIMSASVIVITIVLILTNLFGLMYWWGITLNAVALVNLVMAVGISVEFCAHITRSFAASIQPTRVERSKESLINMGSSVLSGITLTKFGGIVVLGFANSQIFKIYYFRLYLCIVLFGAAHGLIFLPVLLSIIGPSVNKKKLYEHREKSKQTEDVVKIEETELTNGNGALNHIDAGSNISFHTREK